MTGPSIIEGVSNEVTAVFLVSITVVAYALYQMKSIFYGHSIPSIHHDSQEAIAETRTRIPSRPPRDQNSETSCPICLGALSYGLETNCSHIFCGNCIIMYWRSGRWTGAVACPICRQTVTVLMLSFTAVELQEEDSDDKNRVLDEAYSYNRRFSGEPRSLWEYIQDLPALLRHAVTDMFTLNGMVAMLRIRIVVCMILAILYLLSPLDLIPEVAVGIFGFIDDFFVMLIIAIYISFMYRSYLANRPLNHQTQPAHTD